MKASDLNSLYSFSDKIICIILGVIFFVVVLIGDYVEIHESYISVGKLITIGLFLTAIRSKEKVDDERSQQIRYFALKIAFSTIVILATYTDDIKNNGFIIAIASFIIYFTVFNLANHYNPSFVFKETTVKKPKWTYLLPVFIVLLMFIVKIYATISA